MSDIGDIFWFSVEGYSFLAEKQGDKFRFLQALDQGKPREFFTPSDEKLVKTPDYAFIGCLHDVEPEYLYRGQTVYIRNNDARDQDKAYIHAYRFLAHSKPADIHMVMVDNFEGVISYHPWYEVIAINHNFKVIRGTNVSKCERCGCLLSQQLKPRARKLQISANDTHREESIHI